MTTRRELLRAMAAGAATILSTRPGAAAARPALFPLQEQFLPQLSPFTGDLDALLARQLLRVLVPYDGTLYLPDRDRRLGVVADLGRQFAGWFASRHPEATGLKVVFVPVRSADLMRALQVGRGDVAAGNLLITPARAAEIDFATPFATQVSDILVTGPAAPPLTQADDLAGRTLYLRKGTPTMERARAFADAFPSRGLPPPMVRAADINLQDEDLLEMVAAGLLPYAVVDSCRAAWWSQALPGLKPRPDIVVAEGGALAWAVRKGNPALREDVSAFAAATALPTAFSPDMMERCFRPRDRLRPALSEPGRGRLLDLLPAVREAVQPFGFDPLMLLAFAFAESRPASAASMAASARRLRRLVDTAVGPQAAIDERDHVLLAILAAKAGAPALARYRREAQAMGLDPDSWFDNVEIAVARSDGRALVRFIGQVHKYFVAYALATTGSMPPSRMDQTVVPRLTVPR